MLLIGNPGTSFDYEAVYMENGVLKYIFNAGSGYVRVQSDRKYNDGKWHEVQTQRDKSEGNFLNHYRKKTIPTLIIPFRVPL